MAFGNHQHFLARVICFASTRQGLQTPFFLNFTAFGTFECTHCSFYATSAYLTTWPLRFSNWNTSILLTLYINSLPSHCLSTLWLVSHFWGSASVLSIWSWLLILFYFHHYIRLAFSIVSCFQLNYLFHLPSNCICSWVFSSSSMSILTLNSEYEYFYW